MINFLALPAEFTASDPMREGGLWTNLSRCEISRRLREMGTPASRHTVRKLLRKQGLGQPKAGKKKSVGAHPDRNAQFENIARLKGEYLPSGEPAQALAELLGLEIRIAHDPPYCSMHNPIEHRLFPHITRACEGGVFHTLDIAKQFMEKAKTTTGLKVTVESLTATYETGKKCATDFIQNTRIVLDDFLPRWNYRTLLQSR